MENTNNGQANGQQTQKALIVQKLDQLKVALNEDFVQNQLRSALSENSLLSFLPKHCT
jgi:hypothetical protein